LARVLRQGRRLLPTAPSVVRLVGAGAVASVLLAGCGGGGGGGSSSTTQTVRAPPSLGAVESARFCQGLGVNGCASLNSMIEGWLGKEHLDNSHAVGAVYVAVTGCLNCHTYEKDGAQVLKAPDLTHIGGSLDKAQIVAALRCPTCVHQGSRMPSYRSLPAQTIQQMAFFLAASH
jgi:hypothetical protein